MGGMGMGGMGMGGMGMGGGMMMPSVQHGFYGVNGWLPEMFPRTGSIHHANKTTR